MPLDVESKRRLACCLIQLQDHAHEMRKGLESVSELVVELLKEPEKAEQSAAGR